MSLDEKNGALDDRNTLIMVVRSSEKRRSSFIMELQFFLCYRNFYFLQCTVRKMRHFWLIFYHCGIAFSRAVSILYQSANAVSKMNLTLLYGVWKSQKKFHSTLRATFTFCVAKSSLTMPKMVNLASFWKPEAGGQTVLPDRSILIDQKLVENAKIEKFKWDILGYFQTLCIS